MKDLRQIVENIKLLGNSDEQQLQELLWKLIFYSPKMPSRIHQQHLLDRAVTTDLKVFDNYLSGSELHFKTYRWGKGPIKVLLTHGWGSKAIDFSELINILLLNPQLEIIAFDAPGNGASEGALSNLLLFVDAISQLQKRFGKPDVMIGHSLGAMANAYVIDRDQYAPKLLISITPLVNLTENFKTTMSSVGITEKAQQEFFHRFESRYGLSTDRFVLNDLFKPRLPAKQAADKHLLFYEENDLISPAAYIEGFLEEHPEILVKKYDDTTHAKIIIDQRVIAGIDQFVRSYF